VFDGLLGTEYEDYLLLTLLGGPVLIVGFAFRWRGRIRCSYAGCVL